jgi:drug/metabolite transporter (DMT)-like permease
MIIGTLPVVIAVCSNARNARRDGRLPWARLAPSLLLIAAGIACVNQAELAALGTDIDAARYASGALLAVAAVVCWTWYPIRNADWLRNHAGRSPRSWATAQGVVTLPLAALAYSMWLLWAGKSAPLGPTPERFLLLMVALGLLASWLGTLCWNEASQRLPTTLAGQLIVFETLAALAYAYVLRGTWPNGVTLVGIALLIAGVAWALRIEPEPLAAEGHAG